MGNEIICKVFVLSMNYYVQKITFNKICNISQNNEIIYDELINNIIKDYKNNEDILIFERKK